jgi:hypothetical protein
MASILSPYHDTFTREALLRHRAEEAERVKRVKNKKKPTVKRRR